MARVVYNSCIFVLLTSVSLTSWTHAQAANEDYAKTVTRLRNALLNDDYSSYVVPKRHINDTVNIQLGLVLKSLESLNAENSMLTTHVWLVMKWTDYRLSWNPDDYNGIKEITMPEGHPAVWQPGIIAFNTASGYNGITDYNMIVDSGGNIMFYQYTMLQTACDMNLRDFPFDTHECQLFLGSWVYCGDDIKIELLKGYEEVQTLFYQNTDRWLLKNTSYEIFVLKANKTYYFGLARLFFQRHTPLILTVYLGPAICFGLAIPVAFLLPADNSNKLVLGGSLLIAQVLVLDMLAEALPSSHFSVPTMAQYLLSNIVLLSLSLVCSALVISCWKRAERNGQGVPRILDKIFLGPVARLVRVSREDYVINTPANEKQEGFTPNDNEAGNASIIVKDYNCQQMAAEWRQLSAVLDRLLFVIFFVTSLLVMFTIIIRTY